MKSNYYIMKMNRKFNQDFFDIYIKSSLIRIKGNPKWSVHDELRYPVKVNYIGDYVHVSDFTLFSKYNTIRSYGVEK